MDIKQVLKDHRLWLRGEGGKRVAEAARLQAERDRQEAEELRRQNNLNVHFHLNFQRLLLRRFWLAKSRTFKSISNLTRSLRGLTTFPSQGSNQ